MDEALMYLANIFLRNRNLELQAGFKLSTKNIFIVYFEAGTLKHRL